MLNDQFIKSSKEVKVGDEVALKQGPVWRRYSIQAIPKSRVGAKLVDDLIKETTPWEDLEILERVAEQNKAARQIGIYGRPTKKSRRDLDRFFDESEDA